MRNIKVDPRNTKPTKHTKRYFCMPDFAAGFAGDIAAGFAAGVAAGLAAGVEAGAGVAVDAGVAAVNSASA